MTKRLVDIDDKLLEHAKDLFGTTTIKATVQAAMDFGVRHKSALSYIEMMRDPGLIDQEAFEHMERMSKPEVPVGADD